MVKPTKQQAERKSPSRSPSPTVVDILTRIQKLNNTNDILDDKPVGEDDVLINALEVYTEKIKELESENKKLVEEKGKVGEEKQEEIDKLTEKVQQLETDDKKLAGKGGERKDDIEELIKKVEELKIANEKLVVKNGKLEATNERLKEENQQNAVDLETIDAENQKLREDNEMRRTQNREIMSRNAVISRGYEEYAKENKELNREMGKLRAETMKNSPDHANFQKLMVDLRRTVSEATNRPNPNDGNSNPNDVISSIQFLIHGVNHELASENQRLKNQVVFLEKESSEAKRQKSATDSQMQEMTTQHDNHLDEVDKIFYDRADKFKTKEANYRNQFRNFKNHEILYNKVIQDCQNTVVRTGKTSLTKNSNDERDDCIKKVSQIISEFLEEKKTWRGPSICSDRTEKKLEAAELQNRNLKDELEKLKKRVEEQSQKENDREKLLEKQKLRITKLKDKRNQRSEEVGHQKTLETLDLMEEGFQRFVDAFRNQRNAERNSEKGRNVSPTPRPQSPLNGASDKDVSDNSDDNNSSDSEVLFSRKRRRQSKESSKRRRRISSSDSEKTDGEECQPSTSGWTGRN